MLKKFFLALCLGGTVSVAAAANVATAPVVSSQVTPAVRQMIVKAIGKLSGSAHVDMITPAPLPGFYAVIASGQLVYVSGDGKYLMDGNLLDLSKRQNLSDAAWAEYRKPRLASLDNAQSIVFAPPHPKYTVTVFTDVNCGFCRALHEQIADFNKAGIAVHYVAWPRGGVKTTSGRPTPTYTEMSSVWCASDRKAALTEALEGHAPKPASCVNPVKKQFELGVDLGVNGTPTIFGPDGRQLGGFVTAPKLLKQLKEGG